MTVAKEGGKPSCVDSKTNKSKQGRINWVSAAQQYSMSSFSFIKW